MASHNDALDSYLLDTAHRIRPFELDIMPDRSLSTAGRKRHLAPKSLQPWHDAASTFTPLWDHIRTALALDATLVPEPTRHLDPIEHMACERDVVNWFTRFVSDSSAKLVDAIVRADPSLHHYHISPTTGKTVHQLLERTIPTRYAIDIDLVRLEHEFRSNPALHHHVTASGGQRALERARTKVLRSRSDFEFVCQLRPADGHSLPSSLDPFITANVCEFKCPKALNRPLLEHVLLHFDEHVLSLGRTHQLYHPSSLTIQLRQALWHPQAEITTEAEGLLCAISQIYTYMLARRQTYGLLSSVNASLALHIDWSHATEPGQHLKYIILSNDDQPPFPNWHSTLPFDAMPIVAVVTSLTILQLRTGPVSDDAVQHMFNTVHAAQRALQAVPLQHHHSDNDQSGSGSGSGSGSDFYATDDADRSSTGSETDSERAERADDDELRLPESLLATISSVETRGEMERLLHASPDEVPMCALATGGDLLRICCTLWPLASRASRRADKRRRRFSAEDVRLMLPRTLDFGPVPLDFLGRLALADALEQPDDAQAMRRSASDSTVGSDREPASNAVVPAAAATVVEGQDEQQQHDAGSQVEAERPPRYSVLFGGGARSVSGSSSSSNQSDGMETAIARWSLAPGLAAGKHEKTVALGAVEQHPQPAVVEVAHNRIRLVTRDPLDS